MRRIFGSLLITLFTFSILFFVYAQKNETFAAPGDCTFSASPTLVHWDGTIIVNVTNNAATSSGFTAYFNLQQVNTLIPISVGTIQGSSSKTLAVVPSELTSLQGWTLIHLTVRDNNGRCETAGGSTTIFIEVSSIANPPDTPPGNCPAFTAFDPPSGTDTDGASITAIFAAPEGGGNFFVTIDGSLNDNTPPAGLDLEPIPNNPSALSTSLGSLSNGNHTLRLYRPLGGGASFSDAAECYRFRFSVVNSADSGGIGPVGPGGSLRDIPDVIRFGTVGEIISKLLPFIYTLAGMLALIFLLWGGIRYMLARGDPKEIQSARGIIISAVIGLLIIIFVVAIFFFIGSIFKIDIFSGIPVSNVYAVESVDIGDEVKVVGGGIGSIFPTAGVFFTFIVRAILAVAAVVFLGMVVFGGFRYLSAGGTPDDAMAARASITGAIVGLLIVIVSFVIIELLIRTVGAGGIGSIFQ